MVSCLQAFGKCIVYNSACVLGCVDRPGKDCSPATLERIIWERTEELARSNEYLSKINVELEAAQMESKLLIKQKTDFLSIASDELKTPLTSLKGYTEVMKMQSEINGKAGDISIVSKMDISALLGKHHACDRIEKKLILAYKKNRQSTGAGKCHVFFIDESFD